MNVQRFAPFCVVTLLGSLTGCLGSLSEIQLDESADGGGVTTSVSMRVVVTLTSNPSTGYQWELTELDTSVLENTSHTYVAPGTVMPGAPGSERWEFAACAPGTTTLRLEYRRPWEPAEVDPADTVRVTVTVTPE
jgi:inhibitor of cysteine peptidase